MALISDFRLEPSNSHCYVCGTENPEGLQIPFVRDGECGSKAVYTARPEHCGWPGLLHGGITFTLMDEALAWAVRFQGWYGVTAKAETRFREPIHAGMIVVVRARVLERRRRLVTAKAEVRPQGSDTLLAEMDASMYLLDTVPNRT